MNYFPATLSACSSVMNIVALVTSTFKHIQLNVDLSQIQFVQWHPRLSSVIPFQSPQYSPSFTSQLLPIGVYSMSIFQVVSDIVQ